LEDVAIIMHLDELDPVGGRAASGRHRRRLERFAITGLIAANPRKAVSLGDDGSSGHDVGKGSRYQPRRRAQ
jgi:hypothetical protein